MQNTELSFSFRPTSVQPSRTPSQYAKSFLQVFLYVLFSLLKQLEEHIIRLREELDREREERNYFQLERDKVNAFWDITKGQLDQARAEVRNKDRLAEEAEERHQVEIKVGEHRLCCALCYPWYDC